MRSNASCSSQRHNQPEAENTIDNSSAKVKSSFLILSTPVGVEATLKLNIRPVPKNLVGA